MWHRYFVGEYALYMPLGQGNAYLTVSNDFYVTPKIGFSENAVFRLYMLLEDGRPSGEWVMKTRALSLVLPASDERIKHDEPIKSDNEDENVTIEDEWIVILPQRDGFPGQLWTDSVDRGSPFFLNTPSPTQETTSTIRMGDKYLSIIEGKFSLLTRDALWSRDWKIKPVVPPSKYSGADLRYVQFKNVPRLENLYFVKTQLNRAAFGGSKVVNVDMSGAILNKASFNGTTFDTVPSRLSDARFEETNLAGAKFLNCEMNRAGFKSAKFSPQTSFAGSKLQGATFSKVDLSGVDFTGADLSGAVFTEVTLKGTILTGCKLIGANLSNADLTEVAFQADRRPILHEDPIKPDGRRVLLRNATLNASFMGLDWSLADLTGATIKNLPKKEMTGLQARYTIMPNIDLSDCVLSRSDFTGAQIKDVKFIKAILQGADFTKQDFSLANFTGAVLTEANLTRVSLRNVTLTGVELTRAKMISTDCYNADLTLCIAAEPATFSTDTTGRTNFTNAKVKYSLLGRNWRALNLTDVIISDLPVVLSESSNKLDASDAILHRLDLKNKVLEEADFSHSQLLGASFVNSDLTSAQFIGASLQGDDNNPSCDLTSAFMKNTSFKDANLTGAEFSYCYLYESKASVQNATMVNVNFANSYLVGMKFSASSGTRTFQGVKFTGACLLNADFSGVEFASFQGDSCSLGRACLQGATFTNAKLFGANMTHAAVAKQAGKMEVTCRIQYKGELITKNIYFSKPTIIDPVNATGNSTRCPVGSPGPCIDEKLYSPDAPTTWKDSRSASDSDEQER